MFDTKTHVCVPDSHMLPLVFPQEDLEVNRNKDNCRFMFDPLTQNYEYF